MQVATDQDFNSIVSETNELINTFINFDCENNTTYYWRVKSFARDYDDLLESEWSDVSVFHAQDAQIRILEPDSAIKWQYGLDYFIQWEDNFADDIIVELLTDTSKIVIDTVESDGAYKWSIPVDIPIGCRYRIQLVNLNDAAVTNISPYYFSITDTTGNDGCFESV